MQQQQNIIECYDKTAEQYAIKFANELDHKHLDRILLQSFAAENLNKGKMIDLGCGPGQTTKYLSDCGIPDIVGTDISPAMVAIAKRMHPSLHFETADMLQLSYPDNSFAAAIAFYSIVHFDHAQVAIAFKEINRILVGDGQFLFSFHTGEKVVHLDEFFDQTVNIDFYFFEMDNIIELLTAEGFEIIDAIERQPYPDVEYQSKRGYVWVKKANP